MRFLLAFVPQITVAACALQLGCAAPKLALPSQAAPVELQRALPPAPIEVSTTSSVRTDSASEAVVPVTAEDAQRGDPLAPVTIVEFADFECPFSARVVPTLRRIEVEYGSNVRLVFKHKPLPFHKRARAAAEASRAVLQLGGSIAFFKFHDRAFANQQDLTDENLLAWAKQAGVDAGAFEQAYGAGRSSPRVDADVALSERVGANGTPAFRINGVTLSGAQPFERFKAVIDEQLAAAKAALREGTRREDVYAFLTNKNQAEKVEAKSPEREEQADSTVWKVPVAPDDPTRGPLDALVTVVMFSDFQCPFCKRVEPTLEQLRASYGDDLRIVWKDQPLRFHLRAEPAAEFARYAYAEKGNAAFWQVHDALFASQPKLEDEDFEAIASRVGINWARAKAAIAQSRFRARIEQSSELATDYQARGTPHFFINGVRLAGAQPLEKFKELIDKQLVAARALVERGTPRARVYEAVVKDGKLPPPPETKEVAPPNARAPFRGNPSAPVVIQQFADFQCPFCARVQATLREIEKEFGAQVKVVYRHYPLPFHENAKVAAEAAEEALAQRGQTGFWAFHDALYQAQSQGTDRERLEALAAEQHLDMARFRAALDSEAHAARISADEQAATKAGINGTPAFIINGYFLSGAQPKAAFVRLIRRALSEAKPRTR